MASLVAFLDILGTKEMVRRDRFSDMRAIDFTNVVGVASRYKPNMHFAVFSDSVIVSCNTEFIHDFILILQFIYGQWFSDHIFVRGGIELGEINWVGYSVTDNKFNQLENFSYARVYGKALIGAYEIEQKSGPGAICYVSEEASKLLLQANENYILNGITDMLIWADERLIDRLHRTFDLLMKKDNLDKKAQRHIKATYKYFSELKNSGKFLPPIYDYSEFDSYEAKLGCPEQCPNSKKTTS
jgi:hypothetical protein